MEPTANSAKPWTQEPDCPAPESCHFCDQEDDARSERLAFRNGARAVLLAVCGLASCWYFALYALRAFRGVAQLYRRHR